MKCINCKFAITPKREEIGMNFICTNTLQIKGLVKMNFGCEKGNK